jgi:hypothetical protein
VRDAKAAWVMGPSNEICRGFVGKTALLGMDALDYWSHETQRALVACELSAFSCLLMCCLLCTLYACPLVSQVPACEPTYHCQRDEEADEFRETFLGGEVAA